MELHGHQKFVFFQITRDVKIPSVVIESGSGRKIARIVLDESTIWIHGCPMALKDNSETTMFAEAFVHQGRKLDTIVTDTSIRCGHFVTAQRKHPRHRPSHLQTFQSRPGFRQPISCAPAHEGALPCRQLVQTWSYWWR